MDEEAEASLGIGRAWPHPPVGDGEAVAADALMRSFGVVSGTGQRLALSLPLDKFAATGGADVGAIAGENARINLHFCKAFAGLTQVIISTIVQRLSQASGSSDPSAIRVNTSVLFPNGTVPPFFPPYVDLPIPEAFLASQFGALIQESVSTLLQGSFAIDVDVLCVSRPFARIFVKAEAPLLHGMQSFIFVLIPPPAGTTCRRPTANGLPVSATSCS